MNKKKVKGEDVFYAVTYLILIASVIYFSFNAILIWMQIEVAHIAIKTSLSLIGIIYSIVYIDLVNARREKRARRAASKRKMERGLCVQRSRMARKGGQA